MKRLLIWGTVVVVIIVGGVYVYMGRGTAINTVTVKEATEGAVGQSYINNEKGVKFSYPVGWYYEEGEYDYGENGRVWGLSLYKEDETFYDEGSAVAGLSMSIRETEHTTLDEARDASYYYINSANPNIENLQVSDESAILINGIQLLALYDGKLLSVTLLARPDPPITSAEEAFSLAISTLEFLK